MRKTILIVDDNKNICISLEELFKDDYNVIKTSDNSKVDEILKGNSVDIILLDYLMPKKDGLEVLFEIKKNYPDLPVIFLTGCGGERLSRTTGRFKNVFYVIKPGGTELEELVKCVLNNKMEEMKPVYEEKNEDIILARNVAGYIKTNISKDLKIGDISENCELRTDKMKEIFEYHMCLPVKEYIDECRLGTSLELLNDPKKTIEGISKYLGYKSKISFYTKFKHFFKITPQKYRKRKA
jgi:two-component system, response regulator YesN